MKRCSDCGESKQLGLFVRADQCVDGVRSYCKACQKLRRAPQRAASKASAYEKNRLWAAENKELVAEIKRRYAAKYRASGRAAEAKARRVAANPEKYRAAVSARRRVLRTATPPWVDRGQIRDIYLLAQLLQLTVDHIVPIKGKIVCGLHVPWNMRLVPLSENSKKGNSFVEPSLEEVVGWASAKASTDRWLESCRARVPELCARKK